MAASAQHYKTVTETKPSWTTDWLSLCYQSTMPATTEKNLTACIHPSTAPVKTKQGVLEHNEMTLLWADIDSGDLSLDDLKQRAVDHEITEYIIYSTASANRLKTFSKRDEDGIVQKDEDGKPINKQVMQGNRWRVLVSLSRSVGCGEWLQLQAAMANIFSGSDEALRVQQVLFLPTNPDDGYYDSHINKGAPLDPQRLPQRLKQVVDSQVTSELVVVTKPALAPRKVTAEQGSIIEKVNAAYTMENVLAGLSFKRVGNKWVHPDSDSGSPGVVLLGGRYYSHHGSDSLADGYTHDSFDLLCQFNHSGNVSAAIKYFADELDPGGQKKRQKEYVLSQSEGCDWEEPIPLSDAIAAREFPVDALPSQLQSAVKEHKEYSKQPTSIIASSALASVTLACQCHANVARDERLISPISLNFLTIADSGERKSVANSDFVKSLVEWIKKERTAHIERLKELQPEIKGWEAIEKGILNKLKNKKAGERQTLQNELNEHYLKKPEMPQSPTLFVSDTNQASLMDVIAKNALYGVALWDDEGGNIIGSNGTQSENVVAFFSVLNKGWDGAEITQTRIGGNRRTSGRRLMVNIMVQEPVAKKLIEGNDGLSRGSGLLARFLITHPPSTIGARPYTSPPKAGNGDVFRARLLELIKHTPSVDEDDHLDLPVLRLDPTAFKYWEEFYNLTEKSIAPYGELVDVKDVVSKIADNAVRIAAVLHVFQYGATGKINTEDMKRGADIALYYLSEAKRVYGMISTDKETRNAEKLLAWLRDKNITSIEKVSLQQRCPNALRKKSVLNPTLEILEEHNIIKQMIINGKGFVDVNPHCLEVES